MGRMIPIQSSTQLHRVDLQCPDLLRQPFSDLFKIPADHAKSMFLAASKNSRRRPRENGSQPASSSRPRWGRARPTWRPYPCRHPRSLRPHWATPLRPRNRPRPPTFDEGGAPVGAYPKSSSIATKRVLRGLCSARGPARALLWTRTSETESGDTGTALCGGDGGCSE